MTHTDKVDWVLIDQIQEASAIELSTTLKIISIESRFIEDAVSPAGAVGLMQITPIALKEVQNRALSGELQGCGDTLFYTWQDMKKVHENVRVGTCFIKYLQSIYKEGILYPSTDILSLAHYNGGGRAVRALIRRVPWRETKRYLFRYQLYKDILP